MRRDQVRGKGRERRGGEGGKRKEEERRGEERKGKERREEEGRGTEERGGSWEEELGIRAVLKLFSTNTYQGKSWAIRKL